MFWRKKASMDIMHEQLEEQRPIAQALMKACEIPEANLQALMELLKECVIESGLSKVTQQRDLASTDEDADRWSTSKSELKALVKHIKNYQEALSALDNPGVQKRLKLSSYELTNDIEPGALSPLNPSDRLNQISLQLQSLVPIIEGAVSINGNEVKNAIVYREIAYDIIPMCNAFWTKTLKRQIKIDKSKAQAVGSDASELNPYLRFISTILAHCDVNVAANSVAKWTSDIRNDASSGM